VASRLGKKIRSINSLESLTINGVKQWVLIQSNDTTKPVLLILHGGPGYAFLPLFHGFNKGLENHFIVVNWDQRGAGRSYSPKIPASSMTLRQLLADLEEVTRYLKKRFHRKKIYLLGHSFGTVLGLSAVKKHPENYHAYIAVGQVVGPIPNEIAMYDWTLRQAIRGKNSRAVKELKMIGRPDEEGQYPDKGPEGADPYETAESWMRYFGGELYKKHDSTEIDRWLLEQPEYRGKWGKKWRAGIPFSKKILTDPAAWTLDFRKAVKKVNLPVFFLQGRHDYETPAPLVKEYATTLKAPRKKLIWFENSAHFPFYEESSAFNKALVNVVKAHT
jgi:pimeloyl-ACP methyl ester carboxylesterase